MNITQVLDQFETTVKNFATIVATYYKKLAGCGFKEEKALALTLQFNTILWTTVLNANKNSNDE